MQNSHYVPQFILKKFSDKLSLYNVKTGELKENVNPQKAFSQEGFYSDEIEDKLNQKLEIPFSRLLTDKILTSESTVELSRIELKLVKKFLLISVIRSIGSEQLMQVEKHFYDKLIDLFIKQGLTMQDAEQAAMKPFDEVQIANETPQGYWLRTIDVILETDGSPEEILKHPNKTYPAYRWANVINAGYIAFWDSEYNKDEFVITDIGMTSENEKGWDGVNVHNVRKTKAIIDLYNVEKDENVRCEIERQLYFIKSFHENFQMFPISAKRMIVEISPFYKFRYFYKNTYSMPKLNELTALDNEELFAPNKNKYVHEQTGEKFKYDDNDKYIYEIKKLTSAETRYCNALFLDRINTTLGFSSLDKVAGSLLLYKKLNSFPYIPRIDYTPLYEKINKRF